MKHYAGIGQRDAPMPMLELAERIAIRLRGEGWTLRSGHAQGMDSAFEAGADLDAELYLPWPTFGEDVERGKVAADKPTEKATRIARENHPAWPACSAAARRLHARNVHIILGPTCEIPARFVVCWYVREGGTSFAASLARRRAVPVFNLAERPMLERVEAFASVAF